VRATTQHANKQTSRHSAYRTGRVPPQGIENKPGLTDNSPTVCGFAGAAMTDPQQSCSACFPKKFILSSFQIGAIPIDDHSQESSCSIRKTIALF
jgi:hypothetical protein